MTREARDRLEVLCARMSGEVRDRAGYLSGRPEGESAAPALVPNVAGQQVLRRLTAIRDVLAEAVVIDEPGVVAIGRRVTVREPDGSASRYELVIPGEGDASRHRVSADSPVGAALMDRRVGDTLTIAAPAGSWTATVIDIE